MSGGRSATEGGRVRRRELLAGSALVAAGLALGVRSGPARAAPPAGSAGASLSAQHAATLGALVAVLRTSPDGRFAAGAATAVPVLAGWYAGQSEAVRTHVDEVLDRLAAGGVPGYDEVTRPIAAGAAADAAARRATVAAAVDLAVLACEPPPPPDEAPLTAPLEPRP